MGAKNLPKILLYLHKPTDYKLGLAGVFDMCVWCDRPRYGLWSRDDDQRDTMPVLISIVCFIFAVIMQVNIPICDIFYI